MNNLYIQTKTMCNRLHKVCAVCIFKANIAVFKELFVEHASGN